ncbi:MAG TPA: hypothetical protein VMH35_13345 [Streptosporangiaceae bacterium]|nr:hypothetical protein [Streptosporangiaceae bacterium]
MTFAGNMPGIDILACNLDESRHTSIQVKTRRTGTWHARYPEDAPECNEDPTETSFWSFVDLSSEHPAYFIAPRWWIRNDIRRIAAPYHARYEQEHGYPRQSHHHAIPVNRIEQWRERWDILDIF